MNIDEELFNHLVTLYEDDLDENDLKQKLKRMNASDLVDLKNALDQEDFEKVDKLMNIKIEESMIKEIDSISTLSNRDYRGNDMKHEKRNLQESKEIREIAELAGIPPIGGLNETASAGGTSAGAVASGPVGPNKPHSSSKKKKKKKKSNNPYSTGTDDLIRRWQ